MALISVLGFSDLGGVPAHPLFVHVPVVLIPLIGAASLGMIFWPALRDKVGWITAALSLVAAVMVYLASNTGEELERRLGHSDLIEKHAQLADVMTSLGFLLFFLVIIYVLFDQRAKIFKGRFAMASLKDGKVKAIRIVLSVLLALCVVGVNFRLYQVGHSGAKAVWHGTPAAGANGDR